MKKNDKKEQERRRERLKIFTNNNQWMKKRPDIEQSLSEMSAQLRAYRMELQQLRMQEAATEAKIDRLQQQVQALERSIYQNRPSAEQPSVSDSDKIAPFQSYKESKTCPYFTLYSENGTEHGDKTSTFHMYA